MKEMANKNMRNYKFRLYPNKVVEAKLDRQLDLYRWEPEKRGNGKQCK
ncbi:MAG: helix-turn-helix domain-containing protein [Candidatus Acidifodinimicrobium sp.]